MRRRVGVGDGGRGVSEVESRIARQLVQRHGRLPADPNVRHGSEDVARSCRCEVCRRAYPDAKKRVKVKTKAVRTRACMNGAKGHPRCAGWRFAPNSGIKIVSLRDASPCQCPCHEDGRGAVIPPFDEWVATRKADEEEHAAYVRESQGGSR